MTQEKRKVYFVEKLVIVALVITLSFLFFSTYVLIFGLEEMTVLFERDVAANLLEGTLALGALSLTVLGFSVSQLQSRRTALRRRPYKRIGYIMFFITLLSMADAFASVVFLLTENSLVFGISIILLFMIVVGVIISVSLWSIKELK